MILTIRETAWKKQRVRFNCDHVQKVPRFSQNRRLREHWCSAALLESALERASSKRVPAGHQLNTGNNIALLWKRWSNTSTGGSTHASCHVPEPQGSPAESAETWAFEQGTSKKNMKGFHRRSNGIQKKWKQAWSGDTAIAFRPFEILENQHLSVTTTLWTTPLEFTELMYLRTLLW